MAETNSLLNCRTRKGTGGSNPPFSAVKESGTTTRVSLISFIRKMRASSLPGRGFSAASLCRLLLRNFRIPLSPQSVESGNTRRRQTINESFGSHFFLQYKVFPLRCFARDAFGTNRGFRGNCAARRRPEVQAIRYVQELATSIFIFIRARILAHLHLIAFATHQLVSVFETRQVEHNSPFLRIIFFAFSCYFLVVPL